LNGDSQPAHPRGSLLFLAFCGMVMLMGIMFLAWLGSPPVHSAIGRKMPAFFVEPLVNADVPIQGELETESLTVLHLWGPWSEDCRRAFPELAELAKEFAEEPAVRFISIVFPKDVLIIDELRSQTLDFFEGQSVAMPSYVDASGATSMELALLMPYGSLGFPTTILADRTGKIIEVIDGYQPDQLRQLSSLLSSRLGER
jgi:thiol-disulfide isomerase/thioredoxin